MGKYGTTAVRAVELMRDGRESPESAWKTGATEVFADAPQSRAKHCPRSAFFGLADAGLIRGVLRRSADDSEAGLNALYAETAVSLLIAEPELVRGKKSGLWGRVMEELGLDTTKRHNQQMDVVVALWDAGLIDTSAVASPRDISR